MSGGVDSSVAAALLRRQGHEVVGITMCFNSKRTDKRPLSRRKAKGIESARRAARILGIPHHVVTLQEDFENLVIEHFVAEYQAGRTPNPCVRCNQMIKFGVLYKRVTALGATHLATGHYARIAYNRYRGAFELKKAVDVHKDQSYFLYCIDKKVMGKILFPLGEYRKSQVRQIAKRLKLNTADQKDSQDICFVPQGGYKSFIKDYKGAAYCKPGSFMDHNGQDVGKHKGLSHYTIGQRDKLGLALGYPAYVYKIDRKRNTVYVGPREYLEAPGLWAHHCQFFTDKIPKTSIKGEVKIRYNSIPVQARLFIKDRRQGRIIFDRPQQAVTPGQSVVFYKRDKVLGGGIIKERI